MVDTPSDWTWRDENTANDDVAITLVLASAFAGSTLMHHQIFNRGATDAEYSIDGGASYQEIPADNNITLDNIRISGNVLFRRISGAAAAAGPCSGRVW